MTQFKEILESTVANLDTLVQKKLNYFYKNPDHGHDYFKAYDMVDWNYSPRIELENIILCDVLRNKKKYNFLQPYYESLKYPLVQIRKQELIQELLETTIIFSPTEPKAEPLTEPKVPNCGAFSASCVK